MKTIVFLAASACLVLSVNVGLAFADAPDTDRGALLYESRCGGCHSLDENRVGPRHRGVFGRAAGKITDFEYSEALAQSGLVWQAEALEDWLRDPEALVAGQKMNFRVREAADRRDLIAYLKSVSGK